MTEVLAHVVTFVVGTVVTLEVLLHLVSELEELKWRK
jgi:hypothetical protein